MQELDGSRQIVAFSIDGVDYAFPIEDVKEIIRHVEPRPTSSTVPWMRGVINLRGSIIPIVDLGLRLGRIGDAPDPEHAKILVLEHGDVTLGTMVTSVDEVRTVASEQIQPAPAGASATHVAAVVTVDEKIIVLLDASSLLAVGSEEVAA